MLEPDAGGAAWTSVDLERQRASRRRTRGGSPHDASPLLRKADWVTLRRAPSIIATPAPYCAAAFCLM